MLSITIMRDERASRQLSESGGSWILASSQGADARVNAPFTHKRGIRYGITRHAVLNGDRYRPRNRKAFDPAELSSGRVAAGNVSEVTVPARRPIPDMSAEQSPSRHADYAKGEAPSLPLEPCARAASSCPYDVSFPLEFEAPKLRSSGSAGIGRSSSVAEGLVSRQVGQERLKSPNRPRCPHICY